MIIYLVSRKGKIRGMYFTDHSSLNSRKLLRLVMQKVCNHIGLSPTTAAPQK